MGLNRARQLNSTSNIVRVRAFTVSTGLPKTDIVFNTSGLTVKAAVNNAALASIGTLVTMTAGTWTTLGFVHESGGTYQIGVPNTWFDDAAGSLLIQCEGVTDCYFVPELIDITTDDVYAAGLTEPVDANVTQVNGTAVKGDGTSGDKFRSTLVT